MARAIAVYSGGIHYRGEAAVREDGALYRRVQNKDPRYGYKWGRWEAAGTVDVNALPETVPLGWSDMRRDYGDAAARVRLPNA